jgi:hypothetical protein
MADHDLKDLDCQALAEELADRMELDEDERKKFIHRCMTRAGYKATNTWVPPEDSEHGSGSSGSDRRTKGWFPNA